jgi:hypothetical protein
MTTSPIGDNQQLVAYLQAWRQLLEPSMTMTPGLPLPVAPFAMPAPPVGSPFIPPMPPTASNPPTPPSPADYTQQLFCYLQAWRQYLEQMTGGATSGPVQPFSPQPTQAPTPPGNPSGNQINYANVPNASTYPPPYPSSPPNDPVPPGNDSGSGAGDDSGNTSNGTGTMPPPHFVDVVPKYPGGSQIVEVSTFLRRGTPYRAMESARLDASRLASQLQAAPKSLYASGSPLAAPRPPDSGPARPRRSTLSDSGARERGAVPIDVNALTDAVRAPERRAPLTDDRAALKLPENKLGYQH